MANIQDSINQIKNAVYGKEVRGSIVNALETINNEHEKQIYYVKQIFATNNPYIEKANDNYFLYFDYIKLNPLKINLSWINIKDQLAFNVATSPNGKETIQINHNYILVINYETKRLQVIEIAAYNPAQYFLIFANVAGINSSPLLDIYNYENNKKLNQDLNNLASSGNVNVCLNEFTYEVLERQTNNHNFLYFKHGSLKVISNIINNDYTWEQVLACFAEGQTITVNGVKYLKLDNEQAYVYNLNDNRFYISPIASINAREEIILILNNKGYIQGGYLMNIFNRFKNV